MASGENSTGNYAVTTQHRDSILARIANGEFATQVAESLQISKSAISQAFANDPDYRLAREYGMEVRLDKSLDEIEDAGEDLNLARVKEIKARRIEWRAEREFPHRWGQKTESHVITESYSDALKRISERNMRTVSHEQQTDIPTDGIAHNGCYVKSEDGQK